MREASPESRFRTSGWASSFTLNQRRDQVDRVQGRVQLDGIGKLRFRVTEPMHGRLRSMTVSRDAAGRWFGSFTADGVPAPAITPAARESLGIDLGLRATAAFSDGTTVAAPKHLATKLKRLRRYHRQQARQRAAAARRNHQHHVSAATVAAAQVIVLENLGVKP